MVSVKGHLRLFGLQALVMTLLLAGCASMDSNKRNDASGLPPILTQDELRASRCQSRQDSDHPRGV